MFWQNMFMPLAEALGIQAHKYTRMMHRIYDAAGEKTGYVRAFIQNKRAEKSCSRIQSRTAGYQSSRQTSTQATSQTKPRTPKATSVESDKGQGPKEPRAKNAESQKIRERKVPRAKRAESDTR